MSRYTTITQTTIPTWRLGMRAALRAIGNEISKGLLAAWSERTQILIELPLFIATFLLLSVVIGKGQAISTGQVDWSLDTDRLTWMFIGFAAYMFYYLQTAKLFWRLLGEIQSGTLEQVYLSPLPSWMIAAAGRVVAATVETAFVIAGLYLATELIADLGVRWRTQAFLTLLFLVAGGVGYSLVIGGLTLVWKRIEMINDLFFMLLFLFGGVLLPLERMPAWTAALARLIPITHAIQSLRNVLLEGRPVMTLWGDGGLAWLSATTVAWLIGGILAFRLGEKIAKRQGSLGRY